MQSISSKTTKLIVVMTMMIVFLLSNISLSTAFAAPDANTSTANNTSNQDGFKPFSDDGVTTSEEALIMDDNLTKSELGVYTLTGKYTYSNLYAAILYSKSKASTLDSMDISFEEISKYPVGNEEETAAYGRLSEPGYGEDSKQAGIQTASYIKTLYDYDYLVPIPKDITAANSVSEFFNSLLKKIGQQASDKVLNTSLQSASASAGLFDSMVSMTKWLETQVTHLNIAEFVGLTGDDGLDDTVDTKSIDTDEQGLIGYVINKLINITGLKDIIVPLANIINMIIMGIFACTVIWAFSQANAKKAISATRIIFIRFITLICLLTVPGMLKDVIDMATDKVTQDFSSPMTFNSNYVVDSLKWAAALNLSLGALHPDGTLPTDEVKAASDFKPTNERIQRLMATIDSRLSIDDVTTKDGKKAYNSAGKAKSLLVDVASHKEATVDAYFALISSIDVNNTKVAASFGPKEGDKIDVGKAFNKKRYLEQFNQNQIYFLSTNEQFDKEKFPSMFEYDDKSGDVKITVNDIGAMTEANIEKLRQENGTDAKAIKIYQQDFPVSKASGPFKVEPVKWNAPSSYIYGARSSTNVSAEYAEFTNFINGPKTMQNNNPLSGEDDFDGEDEDSTSTTDSEDSTDTPADTPADTGSGKDKTTEITGLEKKRVAMFTNAASIALMNKYQGIVTTPGSQVNSLSTQSVAFLLQTDRTVTSALRYSGVNTIASDTSASKSTGTNGNKFSRYTIPNTGLSDLTSRIGALTVMWLSSAIISVFAFIYLLRAPIFMAIFKQFKLFLKSLFFGDFTALLSYLAYYGAMKLSFSFAYMGTYLGATIASGLLSKSDGLMKIFAVDAFTSGINSENPVVDAAELATGQEIAIPSITCLILALVLCVIFTWPALHYTVGGKERKISLLGAFILIPYTIAESIEESMERLHNKIYGKSGSRFGKSMSSRLRAVDQKQELKTKGKQLGTAVAMTGLTAATGGLAAGAMGTMGTSLSKLGGSLATKSLAMGAKDAGGAGLLSKSTGIAGKVASKSGNMIANKAEDYKYRNGTRRNEILDNYDLEDSMRDLDKDMMDESLDPTKNENLDYINDKADNGKDVYTTKGNLKDAREEVNKDINEENESITNKNKQTEEQIKQSHIEDEIARRKALYEQQNDEKENQQNNSESAYKSTSTLDKDGLDRENNNESTIAEEAQNNSQENLQNNDIPTNTDFKADTINADKLNINDATTQSENVENAQTQNEQVQDAQTQTEKTENEQVQNGQTLEERVQDSEVQDINETGVNSNNANEDERISELKADNADVQNLQVQDAQTQSENVENAQTQSENVENAQTQNEQVQDAQTQNEQVQDAQTQNDKISNLDERVDSATDDKTGLSKQDQLTAAATAAAVAALTQMKDKDGAERAKQAEIKQQEQEEQLKQQELAKQQKEREDSLKPENIKLSKEQQEQMNQEIAANKIPTRDTHVVRNYNKEKDGYKDQPEYKQLVKEQPHAKLDNKIAYSDRYNKAIDQANYHQAKRHELTSKQTEVQKMIDNLKDQHARMNTKPENDQRFIKAQNVLGQLNERIESNAKAEQVHLNHAHKIQNGVRGSITNDTGAIAAATQFSKVIADNILDTNMAQKGKESHDAARDTRYENTGSKGSSRADQRANTVHQQRVANDLNDETQNILRHMSKSMKATEDLMKNSDKNKHYIVEKSQPPEGPNGPINNNRTPNGPLPSGGATIINNSKSVVNNTSKNDQLQVKPDKGPTIKGNGNNPIPPQPQVNVAPSNVTIDPNILKSTGMNKGEDRIIEKHIINNTETINNNNNKETINNNNNKETINNKETFNNNKETFNNNTHTNSSIITNKDTIKETINNVNNKETIKETKNNAKEIIKNNKETFNNTTNNLKETFTNNHTQTNNNNYINGQVKNVNSNLKDNIKESLKNNQFNDQSKNIEPKKPFKRNE